MVLVLSVCRAKRGNVEPGSTTPRGALVISGAKRRSPFSLNNVVLHIVFAIPVYSNISVYTQSAQRLF